jgi:hypothetical protein
MKVKVLKNAKKAPARDVCPWMIMVPPENSK